MTIMIAEPSAQRTEVAAKILPLIRAQIEWDDYVSEYYCPVTHECFSIIKRNPVDVDADSPEEYRVDSNQKHHFRERGHVQTREDALLAIVEAVAQNVINANARIASCFDLPDVAPEWTHRDLGSMEIASLEFEGYLIEVKNLDGDQSSYTVSLPDKGIVANGASCLGDHFEACKAAAWAMLQDYED